MTESNEPPTDRDLERTCASAPPTTCGPAARSASRSRDVGVRRERLRRRRNEGNSAGGGRFGGPDLRTLRIEAGAACSVARPEERRAAATPERRHRPRRTGRRNAL